MSKPVPYDHLHRDVAGLIEQGRQASARTVNAVMTATYWLVGRRIVEFEQGGKGRAARGAGVIDRLATDLTATFGRGFGAVNLTQMRRFYLLWTAAGNLQTPSEDRDQPSQGRKLQTLSESSRAEGADAGWAIVQAIAQRFPLPWSAYVRLLGVKDDGARRFYETEALRGGWSVRQLDRQIDSLFYERTALSRNKAKLLTAGAKAKPEDAVSAEAAVKDPFVLEFLGLRDEYSENDLEAALIQHLEHFLLELGGDFTFVGRQRRLRVGDAWYRIDLLFYHRRLRCLVVIDLKTGRFTHADAGQMHLYLNYAREHWTLPGENPPVGLILCASKDAAVAHYALENLPNKVMATEYRMALPDEKTIASEIESTRQKLQTKNGSRRQRTEHGTR